MLVTNLLPEIFRRSNLKIDIEDCKQGSVYAVNYILQLPSGGSEQFTGWPDFTISRRYLPTAKRRQLRAYSRRRRIGGIGQIESPTTKDKTKAFAQAGIYGVGQLARTTQKNMAVVIIFKTFLLWLQLQLPTFQQFRLKCL